MHPVDLRKELKPLMTRSECAKRLHVSVATVKRDEIRGLGKCQRTLFFCARDLGISELLGEE